MKDLLLKLNENTPTDDNTWEDVIDNSNDGFDIIAKRDVTIALFKTYIDYLFESGKSLFGIKSEVESVLNTSIEKFNVGSRDMVNEIMNYANEICKPFNYKKTLLNHIGQASKNNTFNDTKIKFSLESVYSSKHMEEVTSYSEALFNKYKAKLTNVFPKEFVDKLK